MHPELFTFPLHGQPRTVHWYGVMVVAGMAAALAVAARRAPRYGVAPFDELALGLLCCVGGVGGAWLFYVALNWHQFLATPRLFIEQPGLVFYGGFAGASAVGLAYLRAYRVPLGPAADAGAPALPLGHALGRVGCFLGGCCYGRPTGSRLGMMFDPHTPAGIACAAHGPIHPVQLYEAAGLAAIALATWAAGPRLSRQPPGTLFLLYLALYALLRLGTEQLRGDFVERGYLVPGFLSTSQAIAIALLGAAVGIYLRNRRSTRSYQESTA